MQLGKTKYDVLIDEICKEFESVMGPNIVLVEKKITVEHMGCFRILYKYLPLKYDFDFDSDRDAFSIHVYDREGASNNLYRIEKHRTETTIENVRNAVQLLKKVLEENNFCLYLTRDDKLYRKTDAGYKRVKDLRGLLGN